MHDIVEKINHNNYIKISSQTPFGFTSNSINKYSAFPFENSFRLVGSYGRTAYVAREDISKNIEWLSKYKVCVNMAVSGNLGCNKAPYNVITIPGYLQPNEICTQTYLVSITDTSGEAHNIVKYLRTKFVRFLVMICISGVTISPETFSFVPLQNFKENSDIDWSLSITDIDQKLYIKYNLTQDEIAYIEKMIKPVN